MHCPFGFLPNVSCIQWDLSPLARGSSEDSQPWGLFFLWKLFLPGRWSFTVCAHRLIFSQRLRGPREDFWNSLHAALSLRSSSHKYQPSGLPHLSSPSSQQGCLTGFSFFAGTTAYKLNPASILGNDKAHFVLFVLGITHCPMYLNRFFVLWLVF